MNGVVAGRGEFRTSRLWLAPLCQCLPFLSLLYFPTHASLCGAPDARGYTACSIWYAPAVLILVPLSACWGFGYLLSGAWKHFLLAQIRQIGLKARTPPHGLLYTCCS
jgi:hypothetical protein